MHHYWLITTQITNNFLTILTTCIIVIVLILMVVLFSIFQSRKTKILLEQKEKEQHYLQIIGQTQIEIREQVLRNISWELHDNIGQLLTLAKIQLQNSNDDGSLGEIQSIISQSLNEIRSLSKSINPEFLKEIELHQALKLEVDRLNRMNILNAELNIKGEMFRLDKTKEIIIFRILQEFINNTVKHSQALNLIFNLNYKTDNLCIEAKDDGIGFDSSKKEIQSIGLLGISEKSKLIGAEIKLESQINIGTKLTIRYK